jgi:hypothetical protein
MTNPTLITGDDIASYLPPSFSHEQKLQSISNVETLRKHITQKLPIALIYNKIHRIIVPGSIYLQHRTSAQSAQITHPIHWYPHKMPVEWGWARRAVGFDGLELIRGRDEDTEQWKTYHIDKIDDLHLLTREQVAEIFWDFDRDRVAHLSQTIPWFCKNWNYWFRRIMIEREGKSNLKVPRHFYK